MSRPVFLLCCALISFFLILVHQYHFEYSPNDHDSRLLRRNISPYGPRESDITYQWNKGGDAVSRKQVDDLISRIDDLKRIKLSISNELRMIEREKVKLLKEQANLAAKNDKLLSQIGRSKAQLKQLELDISANRRRKFEQTCDISRTAPILFNPLKSQDIDQQYPLDNSSHNYEISKKPYHFDLSLCPLSREFKFHLLNKNKIYESNDEKPKSKFAIAIDILSNHRQHSQIQSEACLLVTLSESDSTPLLTAYKNHLVINLGNNPNLVGNAATASSAFPNGSFRDDIDIVIPSTWKSPLDYDSIIGSISPQSPLERKYLASYFGRGSVGHNLEEALQIIHRNSIDDLFLFINDCSLDTNIHCFQEKEKMIELSTFTILFSSPEHSDNYTNDLIYLALSKGTVPVLFGKESFPSKVRSRLPFDEVIDWRRAIMMLPIARLPEMHFILRSIGSADLYQLKYHGRHIFENYLATAKQILDTTISVMSLERFKYPPPPVQNIETVLYHPSKNIIKDSNCSSDACLEAKSESSNSLLSNEILGPRERPLVSPSYLRNYSLVLNSAYALWNDPIYSPTLMLPSYPTDPINPSEYKFYSPYQNYRPIANGLGGSGNEFSRALGGDYPNEQFTIVLLTYERNALLMKTLERFKSLPYLNKIIVVWNSLEHAPSASMVWPDVGVPIAIVKVDKNSLNNRFLPYDSIETDAILSIDDDSPLRSDEIIFAFRVWRQSRDRIVGFPGRYHAWDGSQSSWSYNSNHSCELSMVLTGGAFFHKYYSYAYTYNMPVVIRDIVDKFMNCEDIAMNFLVAHLTRKPPIKVTSRWTFHCAGCTSSLSEDDSHFRERHECLNTFAAIYGYMPLLNTQHRSDSILFKTRLPHDKQKCFKYV